MADNRQDVVGMIGLRTDGAYEAVPAFPATRASARTVAHPLIRPSLVQLTKEKAMTKNSNGFRVAPPEDVDAEALSILFSTAISAAEANFDGHDAAFDFISVHRLQPGSLCR